LLPFILSGKYIYILELEMASPGNQHCVSCIGALSFPILAVNGSISVRTDVNNVEIKTKCLKTKKTKT